MKGDWEMRVQRTLLAAGVLLTYVGVASAAEPIPLTDTQLDQITAGQPHPKAGPIGGSGQVRTGTKEHIKH
jgi:hypothetical protein